MTCCVLTILSFRKQLLIAKLKNRQPEHFYIKLLPINHLDLFSCLVCILPVKMLNIHISIVVNLGHLPVLILVLAVTARFPLGLWLWKPGFPRSHSAHMVWPCFTLPAPTPTAQTCAWQSSRDPASPSNWSDLLSGEQLFWGPYFQPYG